MGEEKFLEHVRNPRNVGLLEDANVVIQAGDPECGDKLIFFARIEDGVLRNIRFLIEGCETSVATSSIVTELVEGQRLEAVLTLSDEKIAAALGGLSAEKMHCSSMAASALHAAVRHYQDTKEGEASSLVHSFENYRIVTQVLNEPLANVYSAGYDL